ncbi:MAG TPA: hypothetical protein DIC30_10345 [Oceanospirillales bacterium]|jgi:hypothetical protein|nr:hypothetical protein [Oleispira sp.]HCM06399.1 hypothetical protein [Oceanospirillales bacterium]|tara:strand:+ start:173 stop:517 length:345 start_codon:yes stop_codon:yes gene_type:complete
MNGQSKNNENIITGYLDTLLVDSPSLVENSTLVDSSSWDAKLALAVNPPIRPQDTIRKGKILLVTESFGSGTREQKYTQLLTGLSIIGKLPVSRVKSVMLNSCLSLATEAMLCD